MRTSAVIAGAFAAAASFVAADRAEDIVILQYALTLEHLEAAFYADGLAKFSPYDFQVAGFPAPVPQRLAQIASHEATHVTALSGVLTSLGQTPTQPCEYNFGYTTPAEFLATARVLEGVGVSAYLGKAPLIDEKAYLSAAAAILTVEARHQALISSFLKEDGIPSPFDTALTGSQVFSLATPFLKSCPSSNPTLPFLSFPALTVTTTTPKAGERIEFALEKTGGPLYAHFLNGLADTPVLLDENRGAILPEGLTGTVYVVISCSTAPLTDPSTIAGPAIVVLENPDAEYATSLAPARRSIAFSA